ncbi:MAG: hypothetical protein IAI48_09360 [Candidatus Eremiobacteraeota bacterium]|nr:hypothetical protein [Candidatus Eremiobacteraeota bacterium]
MSQPATKISIFDAKFSTPYELDVSSYIKAGQYAMDANGCAAASLSTTLTWEQIESQGWGEGRNGVEISTYDGDSLQSPSTAGSTKLYVLSTKAYDASLTLEAAQIAIDDGINPCYFIPVSAVGTDGGGAYLTVGTPLFGGVAGNPSTLPAYGAGARIYRRRWAGRIAQRTKTATRYTKTTLVLQGIGHRLAEILNNYACNAYDAGQAMYQIIANNASAFTDLNIAAMTNVTIGSTFTGNYTNAFVRDVLTNILASIPGDLWTVRTGADRTPKIVKLYNATTLAYTYTKTFKSTQLLFQPLDVETIDQDTSNMANAVMVVGDTDPQTQNAVTAVANDATSMADYLEIDAAPYAATGVKDQTTAAQFAAALLQQNGYPQAQSSMKIAIENSNTAEALASSATGMPEGDQVYGFESIVVSGFDQQSDIANAAPDSGIQFGSGPDALWTQPGAGVVVSSSFSPDGQNTWQVPALAGGVVNGPPVLCAPGSVWTISGYVYASLATGGSGVYGWIVRDANTFTVIAESLWTSDGTTPPTTFTVPAGTTAICVAPYVQAHSGASGSVTFAQPNLNRGSTRKAYVVNLAAEAIYGLPSSVTSSFTAAGDRQQNITFAPVVPNINAIIQERANAVAAALLANTKTPVSIASYCVSANANTVSFNQTSLNLLYPAFLALFAQGSQLISISAATVTLPASQTTWVWLQPSGSFYLQSGPQKVAGAIFMGYYTTNATGVIGGRFAASIGVFNVGIGNVNANSSLPAPMFSPSSGVATGSSLNGINAAAVATVYFTNVPTNGNAIQAVLYKRQSASAGGTGNWIPSQEENLTLAAGTLYPTASQTLVFEDADLSGSTQYDFAVGYVGLAGYGPLAVLASGFATSVVKVSAPDLLGGTAIAPAFSGATAVNGTSANGISANVEVTFTITNQPTNGSLSRVSAWTRPSALGGSNVLGASNFNWTPYGGQPAVGVGSSPAPASGAYVFGLPDITNGQTIDIGFSFEDNRGEESTIGVAISSFAAQAVNIPSSSLSTGTQNVLSSGFAGLEPDPAGSGDLIMPAGGLGLYIAQTEEVMLPAASISALGDFTFEMRFKRSTASTAIALYAMTDSGFSGTTYANGYRLVSTGYNSSYGQLTLSKRVSGTDTNLFVATAANNSVPGLTTNSGAVPVPDTNWHVIKLVMSRGPTYFAANSLAFTIYLDDLPYGYFFEEPTATSGPVRFGLNAGARGASVGGGGLFYSGYCAVGTDNTANVLVDPNGLAIYNGAKTFALNNSVAVANVHASQAEIVGGQVTGVAIVSPMRAGLVAAQHMLGAPAGDTGAMVDSTGSVLHARSSAQTQATIAATAGSDGSYLEPQTVARRHIAGNTTPNLLFNPTAAQDTTGWSMFDASGGHATFSSDQQWGGRFIIVIANTTLSSSYDAVYQQLVGLIANTTYTVSGNVFLNAASSTGFASVDCLAGSSILGIATLNRASSTNLVPFSFTFNSGTHTSAYIRLHTGAGAANPGSATSSAYSGLKLEFGSVSTAFADDVSSSLVTQTHQPVANVVDGSNLASGVISARHFVGGNASDSGNVVDSSSRVLYARHAPAITGVINSSGQAPVSTFLNTQGSLLPYTTDVVLTLTAPSGGTSISASTNAGHFYLPDGSASAASASSHNFTGLSSGATYFVIAYCSATGGTMTFQIASSSGFTPAAYAGYLADGFALLVSPVATPAVGSGGSGGGAGCPGVEQLIETRERGFIRAGDVRTEMHVRHPDGGWRIVEHAGKPTRAAIYRITFDTEALIVDASHLFERELGSDRWENVAALKPGDRFCRSRGFDEIRVLDVQRLQSGLFMPLHVDGMRYKLGKTVSHNVKNHPQ